MTAWQTFLDILSQGGFVMPPLMLGLFVLWYALGWRWLALRRGDTRPVASLVALARAGKLTPTGLLPSASVAAVEAVEAGGAHAPGSVEAALGAYRAHIGVHREVVQTVVILAPLAGLLGTVGGMIETFDSLAEMALFTQSGGVAGGIAEALTSTQMGLAVAVPGVIAGRLLDRAEERLQDELDEITTLCSRLDLREAA